MKKKFLLQDGLTLVELLIAALVLAMMVIFIGAFLINGFQNNLRIQAVADLGNFSQQTVNQMRMELSQSKRLFDNSEMGLSYWQRVRFPNHIQPIAGSRLPEIVAHGSFSPENEKNFRNPFVPASVGNAILFVEHRPAIESQKDRLLIDVYLFVAFFLTEKKDVRFSERVPRVLDLMRCESGLYADISHMRDIEDSEIRRTVFELLKAQGVEALWDPQAQVQAAFVPLEVDGLGFSPESNYRIPLSKCRSEIGSIGRVMRPPGPIVYSVAFNRSDGFPVSARIPLYAQAKEDFPHGFEVMVIGARGGRQVLLRLVLATNLHRQILLRESSVIATLKDS